VVAANQISLALIGMPIGGVAACVFGAAFGMIFLPPPKDGQRVHPLVALPVLAGCGVFGGTGLAFLLGWKEPAVIALAGLFFSAMPVPAMMFIKRKFFGGE
jgi:hypothetical protein